jgi:hypothetical protein
MGHPAMGAGLEPKSAFVPSSTCYRQASLLKGNAVTAYLFTGKRFMCGEYLRRHRIAPGTLTADEASYDQQMELAAVR